MHLVASGGSLIVGSVVLVVGSVGLVAGVPEVILEVLGGAGVLVGLEGVVDVLVVCGAVAVGLAVPGAAGHPAVGGLVEERLVLEEGEEVVVVGVVCHFI